jgi:anti-sigma factor RsiW
MTDESCAEMRLLVQADVDGELDPADAARVAVHVEHCAACAAIQAGLLDLSARVRREATRHPTPEALRARVAARLTRGRPTLPWKLPGAGLAVAAILALFLLLPRGADLAGDVVSAHIRALQPGHLTDVASTDQHTVKPWFDGRLPFAPPVKDLASAGFPLAGGRLDYLAGRTAAALVYRHGQHVIDLFTWPGPTGGSLSGSSGGYNFIGWNQDGQDFWAVSDVNAQDLADFVRLWKAA